MRHRYIITPLGPVQNELLRPCRFLAQQTRCRVGQDTKDNLVKGLLVRVDVLIAEVGVVHIGFFTSRADEDIDGRGAAKDFDDFGVESDLKSVCAQAHVGRR